MKLSIKVILGTARAGRESEKVARYIFEQAKMYGFGAEFVDVRDYLQTFTEQNEMTEWKEKATEADGFIIVTPEYNRGYPGELKMFLDSAYKEYSHKAAMIVGVSEGSMGGARVAEQLKLVLLELGIITVKPVVYFSNVQTHFEENGAIKDPEGWGKRLIASFKELEWYGKTLKTGRDN